MERSETENSQADADLIAAVLRGNREAFGNLYDRYAALIRAVCFDTTQDLAHCHDLCQETFLRAYRKLHELRDPVKFQGWLLAIARFVCREWKRARARDRHEFVGTDVHPEPHITDCDTADLDLERLTRSLATLPEDQRLALHLFYFHGQSAEQARAALNLSRAGFYKLLDRARRQLASLLDTPSETRQ